MILGVSHMVLGSTNLARDRRLFENLSWTTRFEQHGIPTPAGKRPFMSTSSPAQALVFMQPPQGTPVELIHYADLLPDASASPLQMVLPVPARLDGFRRLGNILGGDGAAAYEAPHITCPLWFATDAPVPTTIVHHVTNLEVATRFWEVGVGFRRVPTPAHSKESATATLEFHSVVPQWRATMRLVPHQGPPAPGLLDGPGFRCLSMVVSDPERAADDLRRAGASASTGPIDLVINGKALRLEILQGPDGAFVEILSTVS